MIAVYCYDMGCNLPYLDEKDNGIFIATTNLSTKEKFLRRGIATSLVRFTNAKDVTEG